MDWPGKSSLDRLYNDNQSRVLDSIRNFGPLTVAEIAERADLKTATVNNIVKEFYELGFVEQVGTRKTAGGRPPYLYQLSSEKGFALAVDLSGSEISIGMVDTGGRVLDELTVSVGDVEGVPFDTVVDALHTMNQRVPAGKMFGIGVAIPGIVDSDTGTVVLSSPLRCTDFRIGNELERIFGCPVRVGTEIEAALLAEYCYGNRGECDNFLLVNVGIGVGSGIIIGGRPYRGGDGTAGEWGHTIVCPDGPMCWCGNRGCLEEEASLRALQRKALELGAHSQCSRLFDGGDFDAGWVLEQAAVGNRACLEAVDKIAHTLGLALFNLIQLINPEVVVVDVSAKRQGKVLREALVRHYGQYRLLSPNALPAVREPYLDGNSKLIGAGIWVLDQVFQSVTSLKSIPKTQ